MKYPHLLLLLILMAACGKQDQEISSPAEEAQPIAAPDGPIEISEADFLEKDLRLVKPAEYDFGKFIRANGYIDVPPEGRASVSAFYGGYIRNIDLIPGQEVKKGEILLTLENPEYLEMQQNYLSVLRSMDYLKDDYERQKTLLEENISSRKSFLKAESDYKQAVAELEGLKQKLQLLGINIAEVEKGSFSSRVYLRSPISGSIIEVNAVRGQYLPPAEPVVDIINKDHIHLELQVFEKDLPQIRTDQKIRMRLPSSESEKSYEARVYLISNNISGENRVALVHGHLVNEADEALFTPGMYIEADILLEDSMGSALPTSCVHANGNEHYIWVTDNTGWPKAFRKESIETGRVSGNYTEILSEFNTEDQVLNGIN